MLVQKDICTPVFVVALFTNTRGNTCLMVFFTDIKVEPKKIIEEMLNQSNTNVTCIKSYVDIEESSSISSLLICVFVCLFVCSLFGDFIYLLICFPNHLVIFQPNLEKKGCETGLKKLQAHFSANLLK